MAVDLGFDNGGAERAVDCGSDGEAAFFADGQRDKLTAGVVAHGARVRAPVAPGRSSGVSDTLTLVSGGIGTVGLAGSTITQN